MTRPLLLGLLLIAGTFAAYAPALRGGFVWDDALYIRDNPIIKASDGLRRIWCTTEFTDYYALSNTSFWLEWRLWGNNPVGYHVTNVLLHVLNALLIWQLLRQLKVPGAYVAALVFALHPVNVMSVAWISERKNLLSLSFALLSVLAFLRWDETGRRRSLVLSVLWFAMALLSKTAVVMLPVALPLVMRWAHRQVKPRQWLATIPFFALALVMGLVTIWFEQQHGIKTEVVRSDTFFERLAVAGWAVWFYFGKAILPINLNVIYPRWSVPTDTLVAYVPLLALGFVALLYWMFRAERGRDSLFAFLYYIVMLAPVLGFFNIGFMAYSYVADHWQYPAIIGPIALAAALGTKMTRVWRWYWLPGLATVLCALLAWTTWNRAQVWQDEETLWRDTLAKNPGAWMAHNNLANALHASGRDEEAVGHYRETIRLKPDYGNAHYNLGITLYQRGEFAGAAEQFGEAARLKPASAEAHNNLGAALVGLARTNDAIAQFEIAAQLAPQWDEPAKNLSRLR